MPTRSFLTPKAGALQLLKQKPPLHFDGKTRQQWQRWRRQFRAALLKLMGPRPTPSPLRVRRVERVRCDGYTREKILFNPDSFSAVSAYVLIPDGIRRRERRAAVLCAHGHGNGKAGVLEPAAPYRAIAPALCRDGGFIVIAPDWRSFGQRRDSPQYIKHWGEEHGSDGCDLSYMLYGYFGYQLLTLDVCDARRCVDYLIARGDVDASRIGAAGLSFGGTMTTYAAALDERIRACVISGYLSTLEDALGDRGRGNTCGSQFLFGLRTIGDIADVAGLIAPRASLIQMGRRDTCFIESDALSAYRHLRRIYRGAGAAEKLELDHFEGAHEFNVAPALEFLQKRLKPRINADERR
jgi:dienelactone hydrolase